MFRRERGVRFLFVLGNTFNLETVFVLHLCPHVYLYAVYTPHTTMSLSVWIVWRHSAHVGLAKRSHRNCAALVGSRGWQGGQGPGNKERKKGSRTRTHTLMWLKAVLEWRKHHLHFTTLWLPVHRGSKRTCPFIFSVFFRWKRARGDSCKEGFWFPFLYGTWLFSWKSYECHKLSWEVARVFATIKAKDEISSIGCGPLFFGWGVLPPGCLHARLHFYPWHTHTASTHVSHSWIPWTFLLSISRSSLSFCQCSFLFPSVLSFCVLWHSFLCMFCHVKGCATALIYASEKGRTATVKVLVDARADKDARSIVREWKWKRGSCTLTCGWKGC